MEKVYCKDCVYIPWQHRYMSVGDVPCYHPNARHEIDTLYAPQVNYDLCRIRNANNNCPDFLRKPEIEPTDKPEPEPQRKSFFKRLFGR